MTDELQHDPPLPPPPPDATPTTSEDENPVEAIMAGLRWVGRFLVLAIVIGGLRWYTGYSSSQHKDRDERASVAGAPASRDSESIKNSDPREHKPVPKTDQNQSKLHYNYDYLIERESAANKASRAQLKLRWTEATPELLPLIEHLTPQQKAAWGLAAIGSGFDIYAARVTLINIGHLPVDVSPTKLRIHFGQEAARVFVANDPQFLKPTRLHRGQLTSGLVMFTARADIGAAIRLGEGEMSYADPEVTTSTR